MKTWTSAQCRPHTIILTKHSKSKYNKGTGGCVVRFSGPAETFGFRNRWTSHLQITVSENKCVPKRQRRTFSLWFSSGDMQQYGEFT